MRNPVCPLVLNFYGHPQAGNNWGEDCEAAVLKCGWSKIDNWPSVYWHAEAKALMVVYVDDFKIAAPKTLIASLWADLRKLIKMDDPTAPDRFLGCYTKRFEVGVEALKPMLELQPELLSRDSEEPESYQFRDPRATARGYIYDMTQYCRENVEKYLKAVGKTESSLRRAATPFIDESRAVPDMQRPEPEHEGTPTEAGRKPWLGVGATQPPQANAGGDDKQLNVTAASVIMTTMYAARMAKPELQRCVGALATQLTRWTEHEDQRLHRMMSYMHSRLDDVLVGFIADPPEQLRLSVFSDADFAGDKKDFKSTSGVFLALVGPQSFFPLGWGSRKQTCASHSSVEAEIVAADEALRLEGIPALDLWGKILGRNPTVTLYEDNQATSRIIQTGKYPKLRHVQRLHGVNIS